MQNIFKRLLTFALSALVFLPTFALYGCELKKASDPKADISPGTETHLETGFADKVEVVMEQTENLGFQLVANSTTSVTQGPGFVTCSKETDANESGAPMGFRLVATVYPTDLPAERKAVTWEVNWAPEATITEPIYSYLYYKANGNTLDIQCKLPFRGNDIIITCTTVYGGFQAQCRLQYVGNPFNIWLTKAGIYEAPAYFFGEEELPFAALGINKIGDTEVDPNSGEVYYAVGLGNRLEDVDPKFYNNVRASVTLHGTAHMKVVGDDGSVMNKDVDLSTLPASTFAKISLKTVGASNGDRLVLAIDPVMPFLSYSYALTGGNYPYVGNTMQTYALTDAYYEVKLYVPGFSECFETYRFIVESDVKSVTLNKDLIIF